MGLDIKTDSKISKYLSSYLYLLKLSKRGEVYETLMLMMLHEGFIPTIEKIISNNLKSAKRKKGKIEFEIRVPKEYEDFVDLICKSKYFVSNFSKEEIERRKTIGKNLIVEIISQSAIFVSTNEKVSFRFHNVRFPTIDHKTVVVNKESKIQLTFSENTPLDDVVKYLKEILNIKNIPKKKKLSLGQSFRMLQIENELKNSTLQIKKQEHEYTEQIIAREMFSKWGEKISMEKVAKSLQRIKKIRKEINTSGDK